MIKFREIADMKFILNCKSENKIDKFFQTMFYHRQTDMFFNMIFMELNCF